MAEREGKNSRFFHAKASNRRCRNPITTLKNDESEWLEGLQLDDLIVDYFKSIFSASEERDPMDFMSNIEKRVNEYMNEEFSRDYSMAEIQVVLKHMHPTKAPGLDGMPPLFYQKH